MVDLQEDIRVTATEEIALQDRINALNELAWQIRFSEIERAFQISQEAFRLSNSGVYSERPYRPGVSASLVTLAYLNHTIGKMDLALTQVFDALAILEELPPSRVTVDAYRIINWIYYFVGDFSSAIDFGMKGLKLARDLDLKAEQSSCLDSLAMVYGASGDVQQALHSQEEALRLSREVGDENLESGVLNNLAMNLMETGDLQRALAYGLAGLEITRRSNWTEPITSNLDTIGQIYQRMGEFDRAEAVFREALQISRDGGHSLSEMYCLLGLGISLLSQDMLPQAEESLVAALAMAQSLGTRPVEAQCHQTLSEMYERKGCLAKALDHYKRYFKVNQEVLNDGSHRRIDALKIVFQAETARRDAEIYRLRNVALLHEVEERRRAETELKRLATLDPLTNLFNRRHFYYLANNHFLHANRHGLPLSAMMIDADYFKLVNDAHGHAVGDEVICQLSTFIRQHLRENDVIARYGGDEFCAVLPETTLEQGRQVAERLREQLERHRFITSAGPIALTLSLGVAYLSANDHSPNNTLDHLLDRADQALYAAKAAGRNRVETI